MKYSFFTNRDNYKEVIEEEKYNFIKAVIEEFSINLDELELDAIPTTIQRRKLKEYLGKFKIYISYNGNESVEVYFDNGKSNDLVAMWHKPYCVLRKDLDEKDPSKKIYYEVFISFDSIFEVEDENE
jgi:hypothetical protein